MRTLRLALLSAFLAAPLSAQVAWDAPALMSPVAPSGFSVFLWEPADGDLGALGTLRHAAGPVGLGYRAGIAEESGPDGDVAVAGGVDVSGFLGRQVEGSEIDVMWWAGGGLSVGSDWIVSAPAGLILGWSGGDDGVIFSPYGGAHLALDLTGNGGDGIDLSGAGDLGLDLVLSSGWMLRVGATFGDRDALAAGIRIPS